MKIIVYALALFSAFFISSAFGNDTLPADYVAAQGTQNICVKVGKSSPTVEGCSISSIEEAAHMACVIFATNYTIPSSGSYTWGASTCYQQNTQWRIKTEGTRHYSNGTNLPTEEHFGLIVSQPTQTNSFKCPPDIAPEYTNPYPYSQSDAGFVCVKPTSNPDDPDEENPDPNDGCDEFGMNSFLPPSDGLNVPTGGSVCHTLDNGTKCAYKQNPFGTGYEQTGQACSGEEPEYPPPQLPPPNPEDPWACATVGATEHYAVCPIDPTKECNPLVVTGDGGDQVQHQCPSGCGSVNGQYVCVHEDKNGNGIPDKDETDPDNPDPDNPDPDNPDPNNPDEGESADLTRTNTLLSGLDGKLGIGNSRLSDIKNGIEGMTNEQKKGNGSLAAIASNTAKTANNTKGTSENTAEILKSISETDVSNTFNPESSASFYESEYEDGFAGVWQEKSGEFQQTEAYQFLQQFKFNGGGAAPDTSICFNLGQFMDFGCSELPVPDAGLLAILKVFILISAAFLCRKLIFGG
ncbi:hypothetical protein WDB89_02910 [Pseudoalteromonas sp. B5MOD-1]|uniref:hypothetical protein n=1 Tax=Pseudoalteromonas sp. P80D2 TaxID=3113903 RepID=UPI002FC84AD2